MSRSSQKCHRPRTPHNSLRWLAAHVSARRQRRAVPAPRRAVPYLEPLEERVVLANFAPTLFTDSAALDSGSLRAAILQANANGQAANDITLQAGTYALTVAGAQEDGGVTGDLDITRLQTLTIQGAGPAQTIIDAASLADRVFHIVSAGTTVIFQNLTIRGGIARDGGNVSPIASLGGGILSNLSHVTFDGVVVEDNQVLGGVAAVGGARAARGGGLFSVGASVTLIGGTVFQNNQAIGGSGNGGANGGAGANGGNGGNGNAGEGGGLYVLGANVNIANATVTSNLARGGNGASGGNGGTGASGVMGTDPFFAIGDAGDGGPGGRGGAGGKGGDAGWGAGGGLFALDAAVNLTAATFSANDAQAGGGGKGGNGGLGGVGGDGGSTGLGAGGDAGRGGDGGTAGVGGTGGVAAGGGLYVGFVNLPGGSALTATHSAISGNQAAAGSGGGGGTGAIGGDAGQPGSGTIVFGGAASIPGTTSASGAAGNGGASFGGALYVDVPLVMLSDTSLASNTAVGGVGGAGGVGVHGHDFSGGPGGNGGAAGGGGAASGGGVFALSGELRIAGGTVASNRSQGGAGGLGGNGGEGGRGEISYPASGDGGGGGVGAPGGVGGMASGGGIFASGAVLEIAAATVADNSAVGGAGGRGGNGGFGGGGGQGVDARIDLSGIILDGGDGGDSGDGSDAAVGGTGGWARGGGVFAATGQAVVLGSVLAYNVAQGGGGGSGGAGGSSPRGGFPGLGFFIEGVQITAHGEPGQDGDAGNGAQGANGGESWGGGFYAADGEVRLVNTTAALNRAEGGLAGIGGDGGLAGLSGGVPHVVTGINGNGGAGGNAGPAAAGAIHAGTANLMVLKNTTIAQNSSVGHPGGLGGLGGSDLSVRGATGAGSAGTAGGLFLAADPVVVQNTLIALNAADASPDMAGSALFAGNNLIGDGTGSSMLGGVGNLVGTSASPIDPLLGPLQDNGGETATMALLAGSPAIDAGHNDFVSDPDGNPLTTDQRGQPRIVSGVVDIGAYEFVPNRAPVADAGGPYTISEGDSLLLDASSSSDPDGDALAFSWDVNGDGVFGDAAGVAPTLSWAQLQALGIDDGPGGFTVRVRADDGQGASHDAETTLTVLNTAPTATFNAPAAVDEGSPILLSLAASFDPSAADTATGFSYAFDTGAGYGAFSSTSSISVPTTDDATLTVKGKVRDKDGGETEYTAVVSIVNVAPVLSDVSVQSPINEDEIAVLTGQITDAGAADSFTLVVDWGDGNVETLTYAAGTTSFFALHRYLDDNPTGTPADDLAIRLDLADDDGGTDAATAVVTVRNVAPLLVQVGADSATVDENEFVTLTGFFLDAGRQDTHTALVTWGDGSTSLAMVAEAAQFFSATHQYPLAGVYTVGVQIADDDTGQNALPAALTITVRNPLPVVEPLTGPRAGLQGAWESFTGVRGQLLSFAGSFTDASALDTHEVSWDFGDGTVVGFHPDTDDGALAPTHIYTHSGTYAVTLTVRDDDGGTASVSTPIEIKVVELQTSPFGDGGTALVVGGTPASDDLRFIPGAAPGQVEVLLNGASLGTFLPTSQLAAFGQAGDDDLQAAGSISLPVYLSGDDGHDRLKGGGGHDVLLGGDGDDLLVGHSGRDLLIGGDGADRIVGNGDDDLLIAGSLNFADRDAAITAIMAEWTSSHSYATRIANLSGQTDAQGNAAFASRLNDDYFLKIAVTVLNDDDQDTLTGSSGEDWFWFDPSLDKITDLGDEAFADDLSFILS